jgi:fructuronate reductase
MVTARLDLASLARLKERGDVRVPAFDPGGLGVGVVHLGVGAFHRAHQAVFTEDAVAAAGGDWGICGFTQRSATVRDQLAPQDGLYTVLERGPQAGPPRVVGVLRQIGVPADDPARRIADEAVRLVTLTVTEKGYRAAPGGHLNLADDAVRHDLAGGGPPRSVVGQLVAGLAARRRQHGAGLTVLSCDNLSGNGAVLRGLVHDFCAALPGGSGGEGLSGWIDANVTFPCSVVDRIVPATTETDRAAVRSVLGLDDAGAVVAEPFAQWVIEDRFAAGRPAWERAGAVLTADVTPYEHAKLRLLNGTHSLLAYTGALAGYETIDEAVADAELNAAARALMVEDAGPTLSLPEGFDLAGYQASILERFANAQIRYRTVQVATDGSHKLPIRLLSTVRARRAAGVEPRWASLGVAAWMVYVARGTTRDGRPLPLDDPLADRLKAAAGAAGNAAGVVDGLLGVRQVFDPELAHDAVFRSLLIDHVSRLI